MVMSFISTCDWIAYLPYACEMSHEIVTATHVLSHSSRKSSTRQFYKRDRSGTWNYISVTIIMLVNKSPPESERNAKS